MAIYSQGQCQAEYEKDLLDEFRLEITFHPEEKSEFFGAFSNTYDKMMITSDGWFYLVRSNEKFENYDYTVFVVSPLAFNRTDLLTIFEF